LNPARSRQYASTKSSGRRSAHLYYRHSNHVAARLAIATDSHRL